jgi:hypothetical protein
MPNYQRFQTISAGAQNRFDPDSPVWVSRYRLSLDAESGKRLLQVRMVNLSDKRLRQVFLRIRCIFYALRQPFRNRRKIPGETLLFSGLALLCALVLFAVALQLLTKADAGFDVLMGRVADWFRFDWDLSEFFLKLLLSLPVGAYLFGLIAGTGRERATNGLCRCRAPIR